MLEKKRQHTSQQAIPHLFSLWKGTAYKSAFHFSCPVMVPSRAQTQSYTYIKF